MAGPRFQDLPAAAQDALRDLDHHGATLLAIGAAHARDAERQRSYPRDTVEAVKAARAARAAQVLVEIDSPLDLAIDTLEVACATLSRGSFDDHDAGAMVTLLQLAETALRTFRTNINEADDRLRAITHPSK